MVLRFFLLLLNAHVLDPVVTVCFIWDAFGFSKEKVSPFLLWNTNKQKNLGKWESLIYWRSGTWQMPEGISVHLNLLIKISLKWICDLRTGWFISITNYCTEVQGCVFKRSPLYKLISVLSLFWEAESKFFGSYDVVAFLLYLQLSHISW